MMEMNSAVGSFQQDREDFCAITPDGKVQKKTVKKGYETCGQIVNDCTVVYNYSIRVAGEGDQQEVFDSTFIRDKPHTVRLQEGSLLPGMEVAIKSMLKGEVAEFLVGPEYGFGKRGIPPRVPGDATLLLLVQIVDFFQKKNAEGLLAVEEDSKSFEGVYRAAARELRRGNRMVKEEDMPAAWKAYNQGARLLINASLKDDEDQTKQEPLLLDLLLNLAESSLRLNRPAKACTACREALYIDPTNFKALFRFGIAKRMLEDLEMAYDLLTKAQRLKPNCPRVQKELEDLGRELEQETLEDQTFRRNKLANADFCTESSIQESELLEEEGDSEAYLGESEGSSYYFLG